jgi:transcriptional regulator with XRE-family HTH domain
MSVAAAANDPLRAYVVALREGRNFTQNAVADGTDVKRRTYIAWENGETKKLDLDVARDVVAFLGGAWEHLKDIHLKTAEEARAMAEHWLGLSDEERELATSAAQKLHRLVALADDDPAQLESLLRDIRDRARNDPQLMDLLSGFLAGVSARTR